MFVLGHHGKVPQQSFPPEASKSRDCISYYYQSLRCKSLTNILGFHASLIVSPIPQAGLTHVRVGPAPWTGTRFRQIRCIYSCLPALCTNGVRTGGVLLNACTGDGSKKINAARVCNIHQSGSPVFISIVYIYSTSISVRQNTAVTVLQFELHKLP